MNQIRIIGGKWSGRKITIPKIYKIRPTTNRMRETLFNWLMYTIHGANCLDCFAGSGALGLESLSRQAASIVFIEKNYLIFTQLNKNLKQLNTQQAKLIHADTFHWLKRSQNRYDIVFIDPPFYLNMVNKTIKMLEKYNQLSHQAWIYIEQENQDQIPVVPKYWQLSKKKITKRVIYLLYMRSFIFNDI